MPPTLFPLCQILGIYDLNCVQCSGTGLVLFIVAVDLNTSRDDHDVLEVPTTVKPSATEHGASVCHLGAPPPLLTGQVEDPSCVGRQAFIGQATNQENFVVIGSDSTHAG